MRVSENAGWHHLDEADERFQCYLRMGTQLVEIVRRMEFYVYTKTKRIPYRAAPPRWISETQNNVAGRDVRDYLERGRAVDGGPPGELGDGGHRGDDSGSDVD